MSVITKDLGVATAYGYAKSKGYTGTEEEFAELMASYADVAQQAEAAAQDAEDAKDEAVTAKTDAQTAKTAAQAAQSAAETASGAASTKASEAAQSAQAASGSATAAQTSATAAAGSAQTAQAAAQTATTKASEASSSASAASTAKTGAETARTGAQAAQTAAETAQANAEAAASSVSASAAQIEQNTDEIAELKNDLSEKPFQQRTKLTSSDDLNNVLTIGTYQIESSSVPSNVPTGFTSGLLNVFNANNGGTSAKVQIIVGLSLLYYRYKANVGWGDWKAIAFSENLESIESEVENVNKSLMYSVNVDVSDVLWTIGYNINGSGVLQANQYTAISNLMTPKPYYIRIKPNTDADNILLSTFVHEYNASGTWLRRTSITQDDSNIMHVGSDCAYIRFSFGRSTTSGVRFAASDLAYFGVAAPGKMQCIVDKINVLDDEYRINAANRMKLLTDIEWTPVRDMPKQYRDENNVVSYGYFAPNEKQSGIPYGNQLVFERWPGKTVLFSTIISAIKNPNSVMYSTERFNPSVYYRPGPWYSIVCSKAVSFALAIKQNYASGEFRNAEGVVIVGDAGQYSLSEMKIADILESPGVHTAMITDIIYDVFGNISQIEVGEAITPTCRRKRWNTSGYIDNFFENFAGYNLYRYTKIDTIPSVPENLLDEYVSESLILNYGNNSNYYDGDTVKVTLMEKVSDTINVLKNGILDSTIDVSGNSVGDEVTISTNGAGEYSVNYDGGEQEDVACFIYNDCSATYANGVVSFSCTSAVISQIAFCTGSYRSNITGKDIFPTSADIESGQVAVTIPSTANYIHVFFENRFGLVLVEIAL